MKMTIQNHRNLANKVRRNFNKGIAVTAMIALVNFGVRGLRFLNSLITVGSTPFEGLNRGQLRRMSFLFAMYRV